MSLINTDKLTTILRSITSAIKGLDIFSGVQVGLDVFAADGNTDVLPLIAGNNMSISATQNGITFTPTVASSSEIRTAIDAVR